MEQVSSIVCPNCGANTTNKKNCEYCGSILVRFVDQNIEIDQSVFGENVSVFSSIATHLKKNLELQNELSSTDVVLSEINAHIGLDSNIWIYGGNITSETKYFPMEKPFFSYKLCDANIPSSSEPRLILCTVPPIRKEYRKNFEQSCYAGLFLSADIPVYRISTGEILAKDDHYNRDFIYLDMGQDYESAAKIITDFYQKVYGRSESSLKIKTTKLSLEEQRNYSPTVVSGCSVTLLPILGMGAGLAAGFVKLVSYLLA